MRRLWLCVGVLGLVGCGAKQLPPQIVTIREPIEVKVPVPTRVPPPPELLVPLHPPLPTFVDPTDSTASSALSADGERLLRALIEELLARIAAWEAWATTAPD